MSPPPSTKGDGALEWEGGEGVEKRVWVAEGAEGEGRLWPD